MNKQIKAIVDSAGIPDENDNITLSRYQLEDFTKMVVNLALLTAITANNNGLDLKIAVSNYYDL